MLRWARQLLRRQNPFLSLPLPLKTVPGQTEERPPLQTDPFQNRRCAGAPVPHCMGRRDSLRQDTCMASRFDGLIYIYSEAHPSGAQDGPVPASSLHLWFGDTVPHRHSLVTGSDVPPHVVALSQRPPPSPLVFSEHLGTAPHSCLGPRDFSRHCESPWTRPRPQRRPLFSVPQALPQTFGTNLQTRWQG